MPTAETTLLPAYSATLKRLLTTSAQLDNEPNLLEIAIITPAAPEMDLLLKYLMAQSAEYSESELSIVGNERSRR
jgi:hypothetical protein